jgi:hypothetical protein
LHRERPASSSKKTGERDPGASDHEHNRVEELVVNPGGSTVINGVRGPSKPAWFLVRMPCDDSCAARIQMTEGPAFDVFGQLGQTPLATGVTIYDVRLSSALTQVYVKVPAGRWASYKLALSRPAAQAQAGPGLIAPGIGQEPAPDLAGVGFRSTGPRPPLPSGLVLSLLQFRLYHRTNHADRQT